MTNIANNIRLVALDLDGTLLHEDKQISDYTLQVLQQLSDQGLILVPASGRILTGMRENILKVRGISFAACANGAMICRTDDGSILHTTGIPRKDALHTLEWLMGYRVYVYVHTDQGAIRPSIAKNPELRERFPYIHFSENSVPDLLEHLKTHPEIDILKIGAFTLDEEAQQTLLAMGSPCSSITMMRTGPCNIELNSSLASKGHAIAWLCRMLDLSMSQVLAIGDNQNDLTLLQATGVSVAMGNAEEDVKAAADYVAGTNEEDGAGKFLEWYFHNYCSLIPSQQ